MGTEPTGIYDRRVKVFIAISVAVLLLCVSRLAQMQLPAHSHYQDEIAELKRQRGLSKQLKTVRGEILDRNGNALATDAPRFQICIKYGLSSFLDDRVVEASRLKASQQNVNPSLVDFQNELEAKRRLITEVLIPQCVRFGMSEAEVRSQIKKINDYIWGQRAFQAWSRGHPDPNLVAKYGGRVSVPLSEAMRDFEEQVPDVQQRLRKVIDVADLREMDKPVPLLELKTDDDVFTAQLDFMDTKEVQILPTGYRQYPYGSVASQTIGWVGGATQDRDRALFEGDRLASYLKGEVCGREDGVEYACESILRGRRGEMVYDIDRELVDQTETEFGSDVILTLDIELQRRIEEIMTSPATNRDYHDSNMAAVVIEVGSGDILALISVPTYDLNLARRTIGDLLKNPNEPMRNRAINQEYPAGSSIKPIILIAGMELGLVTAEEAISCPSEAPPAGWPRCLIWRSSHVGHDTRWTNNGRNALKGSCNVYFSRLAYRLDPLALQRWLFHFGYGRPLPLACPLPPPEGQELRQLRQATGVISAERPKATQIRSFDDIPPLRKRDEPHFGIGQGNLRATPLQVANSFATIARDGLHKPPRLFLQPPAQSSGPNLSADIKISPRTLATVRDGMSAVVNEQGGSAYTTFAPAGFSRRGVHVYGKTGSTERPEHAWFGGFAEDARGRKIALAVIVEGGQHGSSDAAPLARHIIEQCIAAGYIGQGPANR